LFPSKTSRFFVVADHSVLVNLNYSPGKCFAYIEWLSQITWSYVFLRRVKPQRHRINATQPTDSAECAAASGFFILQSTSRQLRQRQSI